MAEIFKALVCDSAISITTIKSTDLVNQAIEFFELSPVASAALGRTLSICSILGFELKNESDHLTVVINGGGEIGTITASAAAGGNVKGFVTNPKVESHINALGKLDVARAVGNEGKLTLIKGNGLGNPYVGTSELISGEIAEDFATYFVTSDQTPCGVSLGVKIDSDGSCISAGGVFAQVLPFAPKEAVDAFEEKFSKLVNISDLMNGKSAKEFSLEHFESLGLQEIGSGVCEYVCDCSKEKIDKVIVSLGKNDVDELIAELGYVEVACQFCNKKYRYNKAEAYEVCGFEK